MNQELEDYLIDMHWRPTIETTVGMDEYLFHYTSAEAFLNIVKAEGITFWASRIDCLNDKTEWFHAVEIYQLACDQLLKAGQITENFYQRIYGIRPTSEQLFFRRHKLEGDWGGWDGVIAGHSERCSRFACCFSKERDSLPMWNYYSKGTGRSGYNIGFLSSDIQGYKQDTIDPCICRACKVIYDDSYKIDVIKNQIKGLEKLVHTAEELEEVARELSWLLSEWAVAFKSANFSYENEVRLIVDVPLSEMEKTVQYRTHNGLIVPYVEVSFPKESLQFAKIGPLSCLPDDEMLQKEIVGEMLSSRGYGNVEISNSKVPIRF